jgi:hypothetical protein
LVVVLAVAVVLRPVTDGTWAYSNTLL